MRLYTATFQNTAIFETHKRSILLDFMSSMDHIGPIRIINKQVPEMLAWMSYTKFNRNPFSSNGDVLDDQIDGQTGPIIHALWAKNAEIKGKRDKEITKQGNYHTTIRIVRTALSDLQVSRTHVCRALLPTTPGGCFENQMTAISCCNKDSLWCLKAAPLHLCCSPSSGALHN
jgi:hypothetical protein